MSVQKLILKDTVASKPDMTISILNGRLMLNEYTDRWMILDRSQAHLLMLYLQEHMEHLK